MFHLLLLLQLPFMVLAADTMTWTRSPSIEDDWCYSDFKGVIWDSKDYLSTLPALNDVELVFNGQSMAADTKLVTFQYRPPIIEMNITTTNVFEGAIKLIYKKNYGYSAVRSYQDLPIRLGIRGMPKDQTGTMDFIRIIANNETRTCSVFRLDRIYFKVQHLALPGMGTFEACNICNDTHHRMDYGEFSGNGYIREFGYEAECPEMQRLALDGRLSKSNCQEVKQDPSDRAEGRCDCLFSYNKTREEEQADWRSHGVKKFPTTITVVASILLLWLAVVVVAVVVVRHRSESWC